MIICYIYIYIYIYIFQTSEWTCKTKHIKHGGRDGYYTMGPDGFFCHAVFVAPSATNQSPWCKILGCIFKSPAPTPIRKSYVAT